MAEPVTPELPRDLRARYDPAGILGTGGCGVVLAAHDLRLRRKVAIKLVRQDANPEDLARFGREAMLLGKVSNPHVVRVFDAGHAGDTRYLVMECLEGVSLARVLEVGPLPAKEVRAILDLLLDGLSCVHEAGILHRDIKPSNILVTRTRGPVLVDFGLARQVDVSQSLASRGAIVGTLRYLAPELVTGAPPSCASDLFSVGLVGLHALLGKDLHSVEEHDAVADVSAAILSSLSSGLYLDVAARVLKDRGHPARVLLKALAVDPVARYPSAAAMRHELVGPVDPQPVRSVSTDVPEAVTCVETPARSGRTRSRRASGPRLGPVALLTALVVAVALAVRMPSADRPRSSPPAPASPSPARSPVPSGSPAGRLIPGALSSHWVRFEPLLPRLIAGGEVAREAVRQIRESSPVDLGSHPDTWRFWIELGRWLDRPGRSGEPPRFSGPGGSDDLAGRYLEGSLLAPEASYGGTLVSKAIRCMGASPTDGRMWLLLGRVVDVEGQTDKARFLYHGGLARLTDPDAMRHAPAVLWAGLARALVLTPGHDLRREWWTYAGRALAKPGWRAGLGAALAGSDDRLLAELLARGDAQPADPQRPEDPASPAVIPSSR